MYKFNLGDKVKYTAPHGESCECVVVARGAKYSRPVQSVVKDTYVVASVKDDFVFTIYSYSFNENYCEVVSKDILNMFRTYTHAFESNLTLIENNTIESETDKNDTFDYKIKHIYIDFEDDKTTCTLYYTYNGKKFATKQSVKRYHGDKYDIEVAKAESYKKCITVTEDYIKQQIEKERREKLYSGKVVCLSNSIGFDIKKGKIYTIENGKMKDTPIENIKSITDLNIRFNCYPNDAFMEITE